MPCRFSQGCICSSVNSIRHRDSEYGGIGHAKSGLSQSTQKEPRSKTEVVYNRSTPIKERGESSVAYIKSSNLFKISSAQADTYFGGSVFHAFASFILMNKL